MAIRYIEEVIVKADDGTPVTIPAGYVISSRRVWLPGMYADERAARYAFRFSDETLAALNERICHWKGENRNITFDDLRRAKALQPLKAPQ